MHFLTLTPLFALILMQHAAAFEPSAMLPLLRTGTNARSARVGSCCGSAAGRGVLSLSSSNILVLDHVNINHEKGRHDLLKAFYFEVLGCAVDPRKDENREKGSGTLWANCGINQFHLPQDQFAQVLDGRIILEYKQLAAVTARLESAPAALSDSQFQWSRMASGALQVTCPWGNAFELRQGTSADSRGKQPGAVSECLGMPELQIHVPFGSNMAGISRFYSRLIGAQVLSYEGMVRVVCGQEQILSFIQQKPGVKVEHADYHVSMYVEDFQGLFSRMEELSLIFVNPRFTRKASTLDEAIEQCMFRVRDIIDPKAPEKGTILQLEHELRSPLKADGSKYRSCPFNEADVLGSVPDNF